MIVKKTRFDLFNIIYNDLYFFGKLQLFLLLLVFLSAILVVLVTHCTRLTIINYNNFFLEKEMLDIEQKRLIYEEQVLSNYSRIEYFSIDQLQMKHIEIVSNDLFD